MAGAVSEAPSRDPGALGAADRFMWRIEVSFAYVSAACIFVLMMIAVVQIVSRKLFNAPIFGYIDMVELAIGTFAFLAISYCERLGGHVRPAGIEQFLPKRAGVRLLFHPILPCIVAVQH